MPDVGVLQLTIQDNSQQAAQGLTSLADALSAVKTAVSGSLDLSDVSKQLNSLAKSIAQTKSTITVLKTISEFGRSLSALSKIGQFSVDTESFEKLKQATTGWDLGNLGSQMNQLRLAMTGDWGGKNAQSAVSSMSELVDVGNAFRTNGTANEILAVAKAIKEYGNAIKAVPTTMPSGLDKVMQAQSNAQTGGAHDLYGMMGGASGGIDKSGWASPTGRLKLNLQMHGAKQEIDEFVKQSSEVQTAVADSAKNAAQISEYEHKISIVKGDIEDFKSAIADYKQKLADTGEKQWADKIDDLTARMEKAEQKVQNYTDKISELRQSVDTGSSGAEPVKLSIEQTNAIASTLSKLDLLQAQVREAEVKYNKFMNTLGESSSKTIKAGLALASLQEKIRAMAGAMNETKVQIQGTKSIEQNLGTAIAKTPEVLESGIVKVYDSVSQTYKEILVDNGKIIDGMSTAADKMEGVTEANKNAAESVKGIDLSTVPASGANGAFENAAQEIAELTRGLEEARASLKFWEDEYAKVQKRIKYNGPTEERTNMLGHAEEGFYMALEQIQQYESAIAALQTHINGFIASMNTAAQTATNQSASMNEVAVAAENASAKLDKFERSAEQIAAQAASNTHAIMSIIQALDNPPKFKAADYINQSFNIGGTVKSAQESMDAFMQAMQADTPLAERIRDLNPELQGLCQQMLSAGYGSNELSSKLVNLDGELKKKKGDCEDAAGGVGVFRRALDGLRRMFPGLFGVMRQFTNMLRRMLIRSIIRQVMSGVREGVQNLYQYSRLVGTSFAPAMDAAATSLQQMRNSIGAMLAPALQALIPILQNVINGFINLLNYVNQFFALLNGQTTWTRALAEPAEAFDNTAKNAKKAGKATKDMLADWDELNIIQSQDAGSAGTIGGHTAEEYMNMFEEVKEFNNEIKLLVDGITKKFGSIWNFAKKIGALILEWKFAKAFTGTLGTLAGILATGAIIDLVFNITTILDDAYFKTGDPGWVVADILQAGLGAYLANRVIRSVISRGAGYVAAGVTLSVSAIADIVALVGNKDVDALSTEGIVTAIKSGLKLGSGFMLFEIAAGVPTAEAIVAAGGVASIGIGVAIGIKAIAEAADAGEVTTETITKSAAGAIASGLGVTVFELIGGATFGTALAAGAATTLVLAAGFAVSLALIASIDKDRIQWGDIELTDEQVQQFVNSRMFHINVPVTVDKIDASLSDMKKAKTNLETQLMTVLGSWNIIRLGLAKDNDYATLAKDILGENLDGTGGLIGTVSGYIETARELGKLTIQFTPKLVGENVQDVNEWYTNYTTGWDEVENFMKKKGAEIGKLLTTEEGKKIVESTPEVLAALMQQVNDVTNAITGAKISSEAFAELQIGIGDFSETTYQKAITAYSNYIQQLTEKETELAIQQFTSQKELVAALLAMGADPNEEPLKSAMEYAKYLGEHINDSIREGVEEKSKPGAAMLAELLNKNYQKALAGLDLDLDNLGYLSGIRNNAFKPEEMNSLITGWLKLNSATLAETLESTGIYAWNVLGDETKQRIRSAMEEAFGEDIAKNLIEQWENQTRDDLNKSVESSKPTETTDTVQSVQENITQASEVIAAQCGIIEGAVAGIGDVKPVIDASGIKTGAEMAADAVESMVSRIEKAYNKLGTFGATFTMGISTGFWPGRGTPSVNGRSGAANDLHFALTSLHMRASGGFVRSGDLVMANENGNFEMMGKMGNQPVVANNQQIVSGISQGVEQANSGVESRLGTIENLLNRILQKEFTAKAVPNSGWGAHNARSQEAYDKVTG